MTNHDKANAIAAKLRKLTRLRSNITAEDVLKKCRCPKELDWYYRAVCLPVR